MEIKIIKKSQTPIYKQVQNQIKELIQNGELVEGLLLPSERRLADMTAIHRNTITKAYQGLKAEGYIESFKGKGYKVVYSIAYPLNTFTSAKHGSIPWYYLMRDDLLEYKISFDDLFSKSYSRRGISFAGGIVPPEVYYKDDIKKILKDIIESEIEDIFEYSPYQGLFKLRQTICSRLRTRGINATPNEIQVVNETNHANDYISELFIKPGDFVITEEPLSPDIYRTFKLSGANIITVPLENDGIRIDIVEASIIKNNPKFIYVSSSYNDPTGIIMSLEKRKRLLEISNKYKVPIIEDDSASEIRFTENNIPSIKSLDKMGSVIYIYSFALTYAPGIKLAYILAPKQVIKKISYLLSMHMVNLDSINQSILCKYMESGLYDTNLKRICRCYQEKRDLMCNLLEDIQNDHIEFKKPLGGVYLWCKISEKVSMSKLVKLVYRRGVYLIPGSLFFPNGNKGDNYIRLNFSYPSTNDIRVGIDILSETLKESSI